MEEPADHRNRTLAEWRHRLSVNEVMAITAILERYSRTSGSMEAGLAGGPR